MRCTHCNFDNVTGVTVCQVCGTPLPGVTCPRCGSKNPTDYRFCGFCGYSLAAGTPSPNIEAAAPGPARATPPPPPAPQPTPPPSPPSTPSGTSSVALIGFGAILSLAAASYPWYAFGAAVDQETTLSGLLGAGWKWFPGAPLALIAVSAVTSTLASLVRGWSRARPAMAIGSGLVTLFSATWLGEGFIGTQSDVTGASFPATGAVLATIGGIVVITVGLWSYQQLHTK